MMRDIEAMQPDVIALIKQLCAIPAPSHKEERRAAFIRDWFESRGMHAEMDEAKNVRVPLGLDEHEDMIVVMAHTDTVFPDMEPMPMREEGGRLYCPGVGDDTTNLAALMMLADYLHKNGYAPKCGVLFAANSCEEGLGNLKGSKNIMNAFGPRVKAFLSLDGDQNSICAHAVGSSRYRITASTQGGHSFADFGRRNAIAVLAGLIEGFYGQSVPKLNGSLTTYNVGTISGGTSVNTIAQRAEMLYEYRSDNAACLAVMEKQMRKIIKDRTPGDAQVTVELLGQRPCAQDVDAAKQAELVGICREAIKKHVGVDAAVCSGSTDCNTSLSMGVPSACFGVYIGEGEHTREEWVQLDSIAAGMKAAADVILHWFEAPKA